MPRPGRWLAAPLLFLAMGLAAPAAAESIDAAKARGEVGERTDGYLGLVSGDAPAAVKQLVDDVNARRREKYATIAKKNGATLEAVAALAGRKLVERATAGEYVKTRAGWTRR